MDWRGDAEAQCVLGDGEAGGDDAILAKDFARMRRVEHFHDDGLFVSVVIDEVLRGRKNKQPVAYVHLAQGRPSVAL
jgi:hypothetical protein